MVIPRIYEMIGPDKSYHQFTKSYLAENSQSRERIGYHIQKAFEQEREIEQHNWSVNVTFETFYDDITIPMTTLYIGFIPPKSGYCSIPKNASSLFCTVEDVGLWGCGRRCAYGQTYQKDGYFNYDKNMMGTKSEFSLSCGDGYAESGKYRLLIHISSCNYINGKCEPFTYQIHVKIEDRNFILSKQTIAITPDHSSEFIVPNEFILDVQKGKGLENIKVSFQ